MAGDDGELEDVELKDVENGHHRPRANSSSDEASGIPRVASSDLPKGTRNSDVPRPMEARPLKARIAKVLRPYLNKGSISNCCTFFIMAVGMLLKATTAPGSGAREFSRWVLAAGLFGFAGGITNWLAVKMLFDRVCGLPGSGVIPMRFKEIREVVKDTIMKTFFDGPYLENYMSSKGSEMLSGMDLGAKLRAVLETPEVDEMISNQLEGLAAKPEGMMLAMMNIEPAMLKPLVKPFVIGMADDVAPMLGKQFNLSSVLPVDKLRAEIDQLMTEKLKELTPEKVKGLMEEVIRTHLGWLVVWGNVFGSLIGILSTIAGYP